MSDRISINWLVFELVFRSVSIPFVSDFLRKKLKFLGKKWSKSQEANSDQNPSPTDPSTGLLHQMIYTIYMSCGPAGFDSCKWFYCVQLVIEAHSLVAVIFELNYFVKFHHVKSRLRGPSLN